MRKENTNIIYIICCVSLLSGKDWKLPVSGIKVMEIVKETFRFILSFYYKVEIPVAVLHFVR